MLIRNFFKKLKIKPLEPKPGEKWSFPLNRDETKDPFPQKKMKKDILL